MIYDKLKGVGTALVTPFTAEGDIDYPAFERFLEFQINGGVDYLVVLGTTSEYITLKSSERKFVVDFVKDVNKGRKPIVLGVGGSCTAEVVEQLQTKDFEGIDAILSVVPYYNKPTQEGIYQHYKAVAQNSPLPVILYNVPGRTGVNMTAETTLRLQAEFDNIVAIKEASGNLNQVDYILRDKRENFMVISGEDNFTFIMAVMGCSGVISVSANPFPKTMTTLTHAALNGDITTARKAQKELLEVTDLLFAEGNPAGAKAALEHKGVMGRFVRLPLVEASVELREKIAQNISKYSL